MKISAFILALLLAAMAWLQFDDADRLIWIVSYGAAAVFALLVVFSVPMRIPLIVLTIAFSVASLALSDGLSTWLGNHSFSFILDDTSTQHEYMERSRESLGLAIVVIFLLWLLVVDALNQRQ